MPRSLDRLQPALAPSNSQFVFRLLSSIENPSFPGEGFAGATVCPAAGNGASRRDPAGRRIAPSIRAARRLVAGIEVSSITLRRVRARGQFREAPAVSLQKLCLEKRIGYFGTGRNTLLPPVLRTRIEFTGCTDPTGAIQRTRKHAAKLRAYLPNRCGASFSFSRQTASMMSSFGSRL